MNNAIHVAQYIYDKLGMWIDSWRLQKLTYYAKAWSLAWDGDPIFDEQFEAWPDGPVSKELHRVNKYEKSSPTSTVLPGADPGQLTSRQKDVINSVLNFYGEMDKKELIELTHRERPWMEARDGLLPDAHGVEKIKDETMRQTYTRQALTMDSVPQAPANRVPKKNKISEEAIAAQISRWSETLDWLATR